MIDAYFTSVNPVMPIIDRTNFMRKFHGDGSPSRLLVFAIFAAGCKACQNPLLIGQSGTKFKSGLQFFKPTKVQSLGLISD